MRVLLDENVPLDLARELSCFEVATVQGLGWAGLKNGALIREMADRYDVLLTMDGNLEYQQPVTKLPFGIVVLRARTGRLPDLLPLVPQIVEAVNAVRPGEVRRLTP